MNRLFLAAATATVAVAAIPANADPITFNNAGNVNQFLGNNVIDSGFQVNASTCDGARCFAVRTAPTAGTGSDGKVLEALAFNPRLTISQVGGGAFTLQSFALTGIELGFPFLTNFDAQFGFTYADGTTASVATSVLANYSNPTSVVIKDEISAYTTKALTSFWIQADYSDQAGARLQLDNINVTSLSAVPEPATWSMMIAGFGLMGAALRRRTTAVRFA